MTKGAARRRRADVATLVDDNGITQPPLRERIIGEGSFHQLHGGVTTNSVGNEREARLDKYRLQYAQIRGHDELMAKVSFTYLGHMPTTASNITAVERRRARLAGKLVD